jgi:hypothetical protein
VEASTIDPTDELAQRRDAEQDGPEQFEEPAAPASSTQLERPGADADDEREGQISLFAGGNEPTTTSVRLTGGKIDLPGEYEKGERIVLRVEAIVREVDFVDLVDPKTGDVNATERRHKARITGVRELQS